jgi:hypothetical protein
MLESVTTSVPAAMGGAPAPAAPPEPPEAPVEPDEVQAVSTSAPALMTVTPPAVMRVLRDSAFGVVGVFTGVLRGSGWSVWVPQEHVIPTNERMPHPGQSSWE